MKPDERDTLELYSREGAKALRDAIREIILQLKMISPGLGGGFKVGIVRGEGRVAVAAVGRCGDGGREPLG